VAALPACVVAVAALLNAAEALEAEPVALVDEAAALVAALPA
jgi:hypothetical protein